MLKTSTIPKTINSPLWLEQEELEPKPFITRAVETKVEDTPIGTAVDEDLLRIHSP